MQTHKQLYYIYERAIYMLSTSLHKKAVKTKKYVHFVCIVNNFYKSYVVFPHLYGLCVLFLLYYVFFAILYAQNVVLHFEFAFVNMYFYNLL